MILPVVADLLLLFSGTGPHFGRETPLNSQKQQQNNNREERAAIQ
jgi:hypothetical protein